MDTPKFFYVLWFSFNVMIINALDDYLCNYYAETKCVNAKQDDFIFYQSEPKNFHKCNQSFVCFGDDSMVYLNTSKINDSSQSLGLYVETYAVLNVFPNATFIVENEGFCKIGFRSYLTVRDYLSINSGLFSLSAFSEVSNEGRIEIKESRFAITQHSVITVSPVGTIVLMNLGELVVAGHSILDLSYDQTSMTEKPKKLKQELSMYNRSSVLMPGPASSLHIVYGTLTLIDKSKMEVRDHAAVILNGYMAIGDNGQVVLFPYATLHIGYKEVSLDIVSGTLDSSLILANDTVVLTIAQKRKLLIKTGAHCFVKMSIVITNDLQLDGGSKNSVFSCYNTREDVLRLKGDW